MMSRIAAFAPLFLTLTACSPATKSQKAAEPTIDIRAASLDRRGRQPSPESEGHPGTNGRSDRRESPSSRAAKTDGAYAKADGPGAKESGAEIPANEEVISSTSSYDVRTALRAADGGLRSCKDKASPRSLGVVLRFETSGNVSKVDVIPSENAAASCVRARLSEITVMPFTGEPVTVRMSVRL